MVTLKIIRPSYDKYIIKVNGRKVRINGTVEDTLGYVFSGSVELAPTEKFEIVIKRKLSSVIACFLSNLGIGWEKVVNSQKYSIENPEKTDGEIIIRLNQSVNNWNTIAVSEGLTLN